MSNTIDLNLRGDQSNANLNFTWIAFFNDGKIIKQFENDKENLFEEVKDNFDKLIRFSLINKDYSQCFSVDLKNGFILFNNYTNINLVQLEYKENIRLIFFRRHKVEISEKGKELSHNIEYYFGLQWNDKEGNNQQVVLIIDQEGNWIIGDK